MTEKPQPPKTCFVAMPITTQPEHVDDYDGDADHFLHVLDHLFAPAIEQAGFQVVRPIMEGSDLIQAEIVRRLEEADLVLCDLSRHNPNVFFELGVRTSLDKPVCLVRDNFTDRLPFDTSVLNTHTYSADLSPWHLKDQVGLLGAHLEASARTSHGRNPLWQFFGLTQRASPGTVEGDPVQAKLDLLVREVAGLAQDRGERWSSATSTAGRPGWRRADELGFEPGEPRPGVPPLLNHVELTDAIIDVELPFAAEERLALSHLNDFFRKAHGEQLLLVGLQDRNKNGRILAHLHSPVYLSSREVKTLQEMAARETLRVVISQPGTKDVFSVV